MRKTWLLGFGFFSISITWALYNAFVPYFLERYISSVALIGFFMTIDNYFALFLQPWIGSRSDRTHTRFGRRMPYLLIGMPLGALFTAIIPFHNGLATLLLFMVLMNLAMSLYRSPTVSLMPDITEERRRTRANGIINFMGGVGSILAFGAGSILYNAHPSLPFIAAAVVTLASLLILTVFIKERRDAPGYQAQTEAKSAVSFKKQLNRTTALLLAAIFFWFVAYQGVETLFTLYGKNEMGLTESQASFSLTFFSLAFVLFAIPSGWLGSRFGKKRVISIGVLGLLIVFSLVPLIESLLVLRILLTVGGLFWACININSYPFVVSTGSEDSIGTRTGMYYLVSSLAAISSPPLLGKLIDGMGYSILFYCAAGSMLLALICVLMIRHPESSSHNKPQAASAGAP
ncbi:MULTISPECIES: SLC45 family MFS transporter [Paenibacillus]|uniref:Major facilitator superfamily MFS_1 n=2 Tax=Paenibacillus lactis TaxID=228574 RepID=G4HLX0_9BACL|nr:MULTISPECIES: SLC45 family MFS transporter [Paenibacillus]EHB56615.1 major facilitator superfamily MFS_1 [Paenibacillus lactis 154]MBP1893193.1 MFS family permease [Paenibacillus lactis]MCM3496485.1 SLC45 family MFS transporter [Paenibacillus lactis]GIO90822.1 MFS transporter [Paenibacillus lactis]HAG01631.1 MFS transporter [Paenibacillus lactis]